MFYKKIIDKFKYKIKPLSFQVINLVMQDPDISIQKVVYIMPNEPSKTFVGQIWVDTSGEEIVFKQRNRSNTDWLVVTKSNQIMIGPNNPM